MIWLQWLIFAVSLPLQVLVVVSLFRGGYKQYPLVFAFSLVLLLTTIWDAAIFAHVIVLTKPTAQLYYYRNETVRQFLLFTVVVSLIERATSATPYRTRVLVSLGLAAALTVLLSLYLHRDVRPTPLLITQVTRDLNFGSVVLTLLLWLMLISSQIKDRQLLMVTVGLGLEFTGEAIGQSVRQIADFQHSKSLVLAGNLLLSVSHLMRLYAWRTAFRSPRGPQGEKAG